MSAGPVRLFLCLLSITLALVCDTVDALFQVSTIDALLQGVYDGDMSVGVLRKHGDFGIGTFNGVDGEMIAIAGRFFQIRADGRAVRVDDSALTPFASVTRFRADISFDVNKPTDVAGLQAKIESALPSPNYFYAIRVTGRFEALKTRSVPKQSQPYVPLVEVVKQQPVFEFKDTRGTLAGFRCPDFSKGLNVPGYHLHFLNREETAGGHVLVGVLTEGKVEIDVKQEFRLALPPGRAFAAADLARDRSAELEKVEK
jgi:acetolactate decarboxylase